ncbi:hypothetical protein H0H93_014523 [Arthromyces matolae]|nr:hypothetical protein H0H93_014523 [Arthromyces matolae]
MEGPLKELDKLEKLTASKGKTPSINDTLDDILLSLQDAKKTVEDSDALDEATLQQLCQAIEVKKKDVDDRQKEIYSSVSRLGKAMDKKFTAPLPSYSRLFASAQARSSLERTIALHFLRTGQFDTAETFLEESGVEISSDLRTQFVELHQVLRLLRRQDIGPALEWAKKHRSFLESRCSPLEFYLHRSQYIHLLLSSHPPDPFPALAYANANLRSFYNDHAVEVRRLVGCVAFLPLSRLQTSPYADLASPSLHFELEPLFAKEYCASLGMSRQVPLRVVGDIGGGGALARIEKGRKVMRERKSEWSQTDELPIEIPLPAENRYHSIFACPVSKEQASEQNPPMMMLCGHVIAKDSLHKLGKAGGNAYHQLVNSGVSLAKMRDTALGGRLLASQGSTAIIGRSIAWKLFLMSEEPLSPSSLPVRGSSLAHTLRSSRMEYVQQLLEHMKAPDGSYEEGFVLPGSSTALKTKLTSEESAVNLETNNPLSLHIGNPWKHWFAAVELRRTILQDVERTFPDIPFFREPETQAQLTNILFLYSVTNPLVGYRQGMHEILAPLYYAVEYDSISPREDFTESEVREVCSRTWVAGDAWALFVSVMRGLTRWYEWREPPPNTNLRTTFNPLATHVNLNISDRPLENKPYTAPIVEACNHIQSTYLRTTDPALYTHMQSSGIEPQIYGIRWLRLLFTREFSMPDSMKLWDGLFACDPSLDLAQWVCVAMLIRIRNELMSADYSGQLTALLRYPSPESPAFEDAPHHSLLLLRQALALQMSPTPSTGASLILENRNMLNIPVEISAAPLQHNRRAQNRAVASTTHGRLAAPVQGSRQVATSPMGLSEMIARGLMEKGESLGINKTLMTAVSEIRRNIPELAASFVRPPHASSPAFPLTDERPPEERPQWEPRSRLEMEREITSLRSTNTRLGESLGWIVDVLLQDETEATEPRPLIMRKQEALESLSYVRDILLGDIEKIDESRLMSEEEIRRKSRGSQPSIEVAVPPPPAASVVESRPEMPLSRNSPTTGAMMSAMNTTGSGRTVSSGSGIRAAGLPRMPPRAEKKRVDDRRTIEDPLGVGLG